MTSALSLGSPTDLKGVITDRDVLYRVVAEGRDPKRTRVAEVATRLVFTCRPDDTLVAAMDLMASHNIRRLPVAEEGAGIVGWLTLSDVSRRLLVESEIVQNGLRDLTDRLDGDVFSLIKHNHGAEASAGGQVIAHDDLTYHDGNADRREQDGRGNCPGAVE